MDCLRAQRRPGGRRKSRGPGVASIHRGGCRATDRGEVDRHRGQRRAGVRPRRCQCSRVVAKDHRPRARANPTCGALRVTWARSSFMLRLPPLFHSAKRQAKCANSLRRQPGEDLALRAFGRRRQDARHVLQRAQRRLECRRESRGPAVANIHCCGCRANDRGEQGGWIEASRRNSGVTAFYPENSLSVRAGNRLCDAIPRADVEGAIVPHHRRDGWWLRGSVSRGGFDH
jgi:hypothetical protein